MYTQGDTLSQKKISDLKHRVRIVNETEGAILVSIHQNTFSSEKYSGAQVFYSNTQGSKALAEQLQKLLIDTVNPGSARTAKKSSGVYLMEHIEKTGILVECGFLTNFQEEAKLRSKEYQQLLCGIISSALISYITS